MYIIKSILAISILLCSIGVSAQFKDSGEVSLSQSKRQSLSTVAKDYQIYFFFRSDCGYCHQVAPKLKSFAKQYHLQVIPITLDRQGLPSYPHPQLDDGKADDWEIIGVPSIYAVNHQTKNVYAVAYGAEKMQTIADRLAEIGANE